MSQLIFCFAVALNAQLTHNPPKPDIEVERAARDFRIQVYETFRTNREEYDARREAGDKLLSDWKKAQQPRAYREHVIAWFHDATVYSLENEVAALPEVPHLPQAPKAIAGEQQPGNQPGQVEFHVFSSQESDQFDPGLLGEPAPVPPSGKPYDGPEFTPPSKFLRSIQRAILSSASEIGAPQNVKTPASDAEPDDSADSADALGQPLADPFAAPAGEQPLVDPFAPANK